MARARGFEPLTVQPGANRQWITAQTGTPSRCSPAADGGRARPLQKHLRSCWQAVMAGNVRSFSLLERTMPRTRTVMRRVREVLRLKFEPGLNDSEVARGTGVARSTVQDPLRRIWRSSAL